MTQKLLRFEPSKETQLERCRRVLAGCRGTVETAARYFDLDAYQQASEQAQKESTWPKQH